jgi:hypothetical protein
MRKPVMIAVPVIALVALLATAGGASAKDRNRDRIPDRWENHFHLSLAMNQAHRDQDRDRVNNLSEFREGTNPRDRDTDDDGVRDDEENAGVIASFDGTILTIDLAGGGKASGQVNAATRISCEARDELENEIEDHMARTSHDGNSGPGSDNSGPGNAGDAGRTCTTADLTPGTPVHEAELEATVQGLVFEEVELVK